MDQPEKTFTYQGADTHKWIGRIIMAVILGEAIWSMIVSVMNDLVVPWLGDVMGSSTGLPTSFTQRPYDYPGLFVSVLEFCIAGITAVTINYFFQRPRTARRVKRVERSISIVPVESARVFPQPATAVAMTQAAPSVVTPEHVARENPISPPLPARVVPPVANPLAKDSAPLKPKTEPSKPKKPKEVYYNSVGEPLPADED